MQIIRSFLNHAIWSTLRVLLCHTPSINFLPLFVQENHNSQNFSMLLCTASRQISSRKQLHASFHINLCTWKKHPPKMTLSSQLPGDKIYHEVSLFLRSIRGRMGTERRSDGLSSYRHIILSKQMSIFSFDTLKLCEAFHKANLHFCL